MALESEKIIARPKGPLLELAGGIASVVAVDEDGSDIVKNHRIPKDGAIDCLLQDENVYSINVHVNGTKTTIFPRCGLLLRVDHAIERGYTGAENYRSISSHVILFSGFPRGESRLRAFAPQKKEIIVPNRLH
ncbi:MAG: hypothetical protein M1450_04440 [Patescibacteria group bacterium]|nr:hypothetical protein [Patescibacteria group bacterium]